MRRFVPWALLGLLGVGTVLGATLGATGSPGTVVPTPKAWVAGVLATTKSAGTAHLTLITVATSPNPTLRSTSSGRGAVDFAAKTFEVSTVEHGMQWSSTDGGPSHARRTTTHDAQIAIGRTVYFNFDPGGGLGNTWSKEPLRRDESNLGLSPVIGFGTILSPLSPPFTIVSVRDLGSAPVDGVPATRYLVFSQTEPACAKAARVNPWRGRTTIWVDAQGRLVQVRASEFFSGTFPASFVKKHPEVADQPLGPTTITNTMRLSQFGAPVHVTAPTVRKSQGSSVAILSTSSGVATCP
ncbi:MAG TPA: hypothetical protein VH012_08865 [Acidimicrobiales bacterium]|nr:hypothetical protein [Acidimicrobiales bacterium]